TAVTSAPSPSMWNLTSGSTSPHMNFLCSECGDEFILQSQLSLHLEEHRKELSGTKVYTCRTCSKEFKASACPTHTHSHR
uniref:C2H2-type domain-containing protein n=1 Tax=Electrophorus electricus TaxID=8005 RepID=A0AAY5ERM8_ELEEL